MLHKGFAEADAEDVFEKPMGPLGFEQTRVL